MIRPFSRFATGREISVFNVYLGIGEALLIPALARASHTRASAPGRLARKTASWVAVSTESLGSAFMLLETDAWKPSDN